MQVDYGAVRLLNTDLQLFERTPVYSEDGADVVTVRQVLGVVGVYAPSGSPPLVSVTGVSPDTTATLTGADGSAVLLTSAPPGSWRGLPPGGLAAVTRPIRVEGLDPTGAPFAGPETDAELRHVLMTPRQKLILWARRRSDGVLIRWLESPRPGFTVDAANGPRPLACDVIAVAGEPHSIAVFFQVETNLPPCPTGTDQFVLSHRWEMSHVPDEDFYLTRVIEGTIVFHSGVRDLIGVAPDAVRNQLLHPVPVGYRRKAPVLTQSSDGLTIHYRIEDVDPTIMFCPGDSGATQIEILEQMTRVKPWALGL